MFRLLHDEKPTVVRQCINALHEVASFKPELCETENGKPEVRGGTTYTMDNSDIYGKLNWSADEHTYLTGAYFYGCHTAVTSALQSFANHQGVTTYGNMYGASFSSKFNEMKKIKPLDNKLPVYLAIYGVYDFESEGTGLGFVANKLAGLIYGRPRVLMTQFEPEDCNIE